HRVAALARLRASLDQPAARRHRRAIPARRARADQPDLALRPLPHVLGDERSAARLVCRVADRSVTPDAAARDPCLWIHTRAERFLRRGAISVDRFRLALLVAGDRASHHGGLLTSRASLSAA